MPSDASSVPRKISGTYPPLPERRYTVSDVAQLKSGVRSEIWHGWGWTVAKRAEFAMRRSEIEEAALRQLAACRVFVTNVDPQGRVPERLEAAIVNSLCAAPAPFCDVPDKGMMLAPKWDSEEPIWSFGGENLMFASTFFKLALRRPVR
jgi:hypothetical protein